MKKITSLMILGLIISGNVSQVLSAQDNPKFLHKRQGAQIVDLALLREVKKVEKISLQEIIDLVPPQFQKQMCKVVLGEYTARGRIKQSWSSLAKRVNGRWIILGEKAQGRMVNYNTRLWYY